MLEFSIMAIECRESLLFMFRKRTREIPAGTEEVLEKMRVGNKIYEMIGRSLIIETPDRVIVRFHGDIFMDDEVYEGEEINQAQIKPHSLKDIINQRRYYWKP